MVFLFEFATRWVPKTNLKFEICDLKCIFMRLSAAK